MIYIDLIILILILFGAFLGFKRGFTRELVECVGFIACLVLAYLLKDLVAPFLYSHLPFFSFGGLLKGVVALNILVYQVIAFLICFSLLRIALVIVKLVTNIFEGILKATIILGIPSKILGAILGAVEWTIISFVVLFVLALPIFNNDYLYQSKICSGLLKYTPVLSQVSDKTLEVFNEFKTLKENYTDDTNINDFNLKSLDLLLKYDIISIDSADNLYKAGKFNTINGVDALLNNYR